jgi:hypothetical protein
MRSGKHRIVSRAEVHEWAIQWLLAANLLKDHGWLCKAVVVWNILLRAAAKRISPNAACADLSDGPSGQAVFSALKEGLPKTLKVLERRLNDTLTGKLPRSMRRPKWEVAIDFHLTPYYGEPDKSRNELYYGKPDKGTDKFHAYATACIVHYGERYTVAVSWVRRHETMPTVLQRLLDQIDKLGLKIRRLLLDRAFFNVPVMELLQGRNLPFLMPVMFRGRKPKNRRLTGLRKIQSQPAGWHPHTLKNGKREVTIRVCVAYRTHKNRKDKKRVQKKLLFGAWKVSGTPTEIRERYRKRFGIESSYRQMRQAKIYTCTRNPHLRLVFIVIALMLRNLWVWLHATILADGKGEDKTLRLERLRLKRLLDWIDHSVVALLHDGSMPCVELNE